MLSPVGEKTEVITVKFPSYSPTWLPLVIDLKVVYKFEDDEAPNIDLLDKRVIWWNEEEICIDWSK